jgi:hypothetical protein
VSREAVGFGKQKIPSLTSGCHSLKDYRSGFSQVQSVATRMASKEGVGEAEEFVYRISTANEWEEFQKTGSIFGGELDKSSGFIHLSSLHQVLNFLQSVVVNLLPLKNIYILLDFS